MAADPSDSAARMLECPPWAADALTGAGATWCVLRSASGPTIAGGDVDVLVAPQHLGAVTAALTGRGFVPLVTPGRGRRRFFLRLDEVSGTWHKIDMVTALRFGPHKEITTPLAGPVLAQRQTWPDAVATPSPDDAFWALLLHVLLDKGAVAPHHRRQLVRLAPHALGDGPFARWLAANADDRAVAVLHNAVAAAQWQRVEDLAPHLLAALRRRAGVRGWARRQARRVQRRVDRHGVWPTRSRMSVAVVGAAAARDAVISALRDIPVPQRVVDGAAVPRSPAPAGALVVTRRPPADLVLQLGGGAAAGAGSVRLDPAAADLGQQARAAVWSAYARRTLERDG